MSFHATESVETPLARAAEQPRDGAVAIQRSKIKILSLCCVYPNPTEPELGIFVRSRLERMAALAEVKVIAPVAAIDYARRRTVLSVRDRIPEQRMDGNLAVLQPAWFYLPFGGWLNSLFLFLRLLRPVAALKKSFPFQVIDAHFGYPDGIAAALLAKCTRTRYAVTLRGNEIMHAKHTLRGATLRWALRNADAVITVSESLRQFAISMGATAEKVRTISNGVESRIYFPRNRMECRRKLGLPLDQPTVLSAGSLIQRKGHHRVIGALKALAGQDLPASLVLAGGPGREGRFEDQLRQLVKDLGMEQSVRFAGRVDPPTMAELMSAADVVCLASAREGWPNVVHEALACGTPVVASDVGGVAEMIPNEGLGYVVPPDDPDALSGALKKALQKRWDRAAISQWAHARSWEQVGVEALRALEHSVVENQPGEDRVA